MAQDEKKADASEESQEFSSFYKKCIILEPKGEHKATIIFLHGLGDSGKGWLDPLASIHNKLSNIRVILPTAPSRKITCNGGAKMNGWYDIESLNDRSSNKYNGKDESMKLIHNLINHEIKHGQKKNDKFDSKHIILGGFSQGAALSVYSGLQYKQTLLTVICLSGYLLNEKIKKVIDKANKNIEILMYHGENDRVVPFDYAVKCKDILIKKCNMKVDWRQQSGLGHNASAAELNYLFNFIQNKLKQLEK